MDTENKDLEQMSLFEEGTNESNQMPQTNDELKNAIEAQLSKIRTQSMILGFRVSCQTVLDKISAFERSPGTKSNNDHKRLLKELKKFAEQGLARQMNENGEIETVQN